MPSSFSLTAAQVRAGVSIVNGRVVDGDVAGADVYIRGSIVQGDSILLPGSRIIDSVVNHSHGRIVADHSYVESCTALNLVAENSVFLKVISNAAEIKGRGELVADAYRPDIRTPLFPNGQVRMRVPMSYDPKQDANTRDESGTYTFAAIRELPCDKPKNDAIENALRQEVLTEIETLFKPVDPNTVPPKMRKISNGDLAKIRPVLQQFQSMNDRDVQKPWLAKALQTEAARRAVMSATDADGDLLRTQLAAVDAYYIRLQQATLKIRARGAAVADPTNIRTAPEGYSWGPKKVNSNITRELGNDAGIPSETERAEAWKNTDDGQYPSWIVQDGVSVPLFWVMDQVAEAAVGDAHVKAYGPGLGMVMKDLDAAQPLSWQLHIGIEEGYEVISMPEGTGLFLGINEPETRDGRVALIRHARETLERELSMSKGDRKVIRLDKPVDGVETPALLTESSGVEPLIRDLISKLDAILASADPRVADAVELLMLEGINVIDMVGFGVAPNNRFDPALSLIQIHQPKSGDRIVTREGKPHALFGYVPGYGLGAVGWFKEFKGTSTGPRYDTVATGDQTWGLNDIFLGKQPRKGKVTTAKLREALDVMKRSGEQFSWRKLVESDYAPKETTDSEPQAVAPGVRSQRLHDEEQYSALKLFLEPKSEVILRRPML
jgi:hypothetical protein